MEPMPPEQYNLPHNILVARTLVVVNNNRVTARVINVGDHDITLPKGAPLGDLFQVEVLPVAREVDMEQTGPHTLRVGIQQQHASTNMVSADGVATDPDKCKSIDEWPTPQNVRDVRCFLGLAGFYRRFVKDFSKIAAPLHGLTRIPKDENNKGRSKSRFEWTEDCQTAFCKLKAFLSSPPILAYADYRLPFLVYTDASNLGLGAVLTQVKTRKSGSSLMPAVV
ncbi:hypothetical protein BSL78_15771 [Apostichopus japonicus]|uniref:Reverse transcriptase/retrotransposon-derived protein RNase H-like domain-containing protein n=1 Tax=Stichopus japonicus TaxID=307972 RepID=A0A2G8KHC2_STIJA|nr:hypothetical protein BSL78_15771 [Apostichopus japonicus]